MVALEHKQKRIIFFSLIVLVLLISFYKIFSLWNSSFPDFNVFYYSSFDLIHFIDPYQDTKLFTGLGYPIFSLLPFFPFLYFSFAFSTRLFLLINIASLFLIIYISLKILNKFSINYFLLFVLFSFFFFPVGFTLGMGQSNLLALALFLLGVSLQKKLDIFPGILIGTAIVIKPIFVFLLLFFLLEKDIKTLLTSVLIILLGTLLSVYFLGINYYFYYIQKLIPHLFLLSGREIYYNQGFTGFISRITSSLFLRKIIPSFLSIILIVSIMYAKFKKISQDYLLSLCFISLVLIDSLSWQHHFVFLLFPILLTFFKILTKKEKNKLLILWTTASLFIGANIPAPSSFQQFPLSLFLSHVFFGTILLLIINLYLALNFSFLQKRRYTIFLYIAYVLLCFFLYVFFISCRGGICLH